MSDSTSQSEQQADPRRSRIGEAMDDVAYYRQQYLRAVQSNQAHHPRLRREFHSAVINYWMELRPYRDNDALVDKWKQARVWKDDNGDWVTGLDSLQDWVNRTRTVTVNESSGYDEGGQTVQEVSEALPMKALMRVSMILDDIASQMDDDTARPKGRVAPPGGDDGGGSE